MMTYKPVIKLVFGMRSSVGLWMKDYKFLLIAVMISGTQVNTQTLRQTHRLLSLH